MAYTYNHRNRLNLNRHRLHVIVSVFYFFFNDPAPNEIYTLSLHDALPISTIRFRGRPQKPSGRQETRLSAQAYNRDRKSTRLNSSHGSNSHAASGLPK